MTKYRLIQEYPGSPNLGEIIVSTVKSMSGTPSYTTYCIHGNSSNYDDANFELKYPQDYPNFWAEIEKPLFKTKDGNDISNGDTYFYVLQDFVIIKDTARSNTRPSNGVNQLGDFKTREAAQEFILMNKPCLSIKDICPIIGKANKTVFIDLNDLTAMLKEKVKSKL